MFQMKCLKLCVSEKLYLHDFEATPFPCDYTQLNSCCVSILLLLSHINLFRLCLIKFVQFIFEQTMKWSILVKESPLVHRNKRQDSLIRCSVLENVFYIYKCVCLYVYKYTSLFHYSGFQRSISVPLYSKYSQVFRKQ